LWASTPRRTRFGCHENGTGDELKLFLNSIIDVSTIPADLVDFYLPECAVGLRFTEPYLNLI
jgi:hypothetical protein